MHSALGKLFLGCILATFLSSSISDKPKILIIGDSISIGYTPFVKKTMEPKAEVYHNPGNAQHTGTGLKKIDEWLGDTRWDIVQFNWGLWDLCYRDSDSKEQGNRDKAKGKITFSVEEYAANLDSLVSIIESKTDAKLIFVCTTMVPENEAGRFAKDPQIYNKAAKKIMRKHKVLVNDLYKPSVPIHAEYGKGSNDVHYTPEGYEKLASHVVSFLNSQLK
ncbi:SGNH/GDSL hydrolase family protein [Marinilongibacter aquaticus]|uniref:SGNH/GDSL hydrolase family protein n=1 Tax=Marinilongibacter aquaticus TaxID=2975157 RepID=UPI0021BCFDA7|nr:SGNH/GDSL hydrolase family protein [Marinilongibacter aquaticus]UBM58565.1 SGNH/GDSL hydrolase family protein [Marinilongibacter aquaticus]